MKIRSIETFSVKALGNNPWLFCAIRTDEGITGYGEFGSGLFHRGLPGLIQDIGSFLIGKDPRPVDKHYMDMYRFVFRGRDIDGNSWNRISPVGS
jgi:galactonate dehydratase